MNIVVKRVLTSVLCGALIFGAYAALPTVMESGVIVANAAQTKESGDFKYSIDNNRATLTNYSGNDIYVDIPDSIEGYTVTAIGKNAFRDNTGLKNITIHDSVTDIGESAFQGCTGLEEIIIPDRVTAIGASAFKGCTGLGEIIIPDSVTDIGQSAFYNCTGLEKVDLGHGLTAINSYTFYSCKKLTTVKNGENVSDIGAFAFQNCNGLNTIDILSGIDCDLKVIGQRAFYNCTGLESVVFPKKLTTIGIDVFNVYTNSFSSNGLRKVVFSSNITSIGEGAFSNSKYLTELVLPPVETIEKNTFKYCINLKKVVVSEKTKNISDNVFDSCSCLEEIIIPAKDTSISDTAFNKCKLSGLTIYGKKGSEAEKYAAKKKIPFVELELQNNSTISREKITLGQSITVNCAASYSDGKCTYAVDFKKASNKNWTTKQDFSDNKTVTIKFGTAVTYDVRVSVKDESGKIAEKIFTVKIAKKLENLSTISAESVEEGNYITVNAQASGGEGDYLYKYGYRKTGSEKWYLKKDYSSDSTYSYKFSAGKYDIRVCVKDSNGKVIEKIFAINVFAKLKNTSEVASENIGFSDTVTVKAKSTGGLGECTYAVYYKKSSAEKWSTLQKYSDNTTVTFKPSSATTYDVMVKVKDSRDVVVRKTFTVNVTKPENTSVLSAETVRLGDSVTVYCSGKGGSGNYQYSVLYKKASTEKWTVKQNFSSNSTVTVKPGAKTTYNICVKVKDSLGNIAKKYFTLTVTK